MLTLEVKDWLSQRHPLSCQYETSQWKTAQWGERGMRTAYRWKAEETIHQ
jgi:hypothetical protein